MIFYCYYVISNAVRNLLSINENPRHLASYGMTYTFISIRGIAMRLYIIHIIYFHI